MAIKDINLNSCARQNISTPLTLLAQRQSPPLFATGNNFADIGTPAHRQRGIGDVAFQITDSDCARVIFQSTCAFTKTVLWTYPAADFW